MAATKMAMRTAAVKMQPRLSVSCGGDGGPISMLIGAEAACPFCQYTCYI